jgi:hypothetical protein
MTPEDDAAAIAATFPVPGPALADRLLDLLCPPAEGDT